MDTLWLRTSVPERVFLFTAYWPGHNFVEIGNEISPFLPLQREEFPSLAKRGWGRFSKVYACWVINSLVIIHNIGIKTATYLMGKR